MRIWKKWQSPPAGVLVREKIFEKNNMVSNDSKLPNSARNAIKKFFLAAAENGGERRERRTRRRFFWKIPLVGVISDPAQKISPNYL